MNFHNLNNCSEDDLFLQHFTPASDILNQLLKV